MASTASLTHDGGSDSQGIVSMVKYVESKYNGDASRVYATGVSSGAMMTNVLLGAYPDVFKAGAAFAGVPFGCFAVNPDALRWSNACATGTVTHTAQEWGDLVRNAYPGYTGSRPRMQLWHGANDEILNYVNFGEEIKQWTNVQGLSQTPTSDRHPAVGWTRTRYGSSGEAPRRGDQHAGSRTTCRWTPRRPSPSSAWTTPCPVPRPPPPLREPARLLSVRPAAGPVGSWRLSP